MSTRPIRVALIVVPLLASGCRPRVADPGDSVPDPAGRKDALGDPLPAGATARFGTARHRTGSSYSSASLAHDGQSLAFLTTDGRVAVMDAGTGLVTRRVEPDLGREAGGASRVQHAPNGTWAALVGDRGTAVIDLRTGQRIAALPVGSFPAGRSVSFSDDGTRLAAGGRHRRDEPIGVWDVTEGRRLAGVHPGLEGEEVSVTLSGDGKTLASWYERFFRDPGPAAGHTVRIWDVDRQAERCRVVGAGGSVCAAALSGDGSRLALRCSRGPVGVYDTNTGQLLRSFDCTRWVAGLTFSPDGKWVAAWTADDGYAAMTQIWDTTSGEQVALVESPVGVGKADGVRFTRNDRAVAWAVRAGVIVLWELPSGTRLTPVVGHSSAVTSVAFTPDGRTLLTAARDRELVAWDLATGRGERTRVNRPANYKDWYGSALQRGATVLSPGGSHVVVVDGSSSDNSGPTIVERASGAVQRVMPAGHWSDRTSLPSFSADGRRVVILQTHGDSGPQTDRLQLPVWEAGSPRPVAEIPFPVSWAGERIAAALSPSGTRLVTVVGENPPGVHGDRALTVTGWDLKEGRRLGAVTFVVDYPYALSAVASDERTAAVVTPKQVWRVDYEQGVGTAIDRVDLSWPYGASAGAAAAFSPDRTRLAVGRAVEGGRYGVRVYDWPGGRAAHTFVGHTAPVTAVAFDPAGTTVAAGSEDTTVLLWGLGPFMALH